MTKNETESSSAFVVVSRKSLIVGFTLTAILSFFAGYLWGYEGSSPQGKLVTSVEADSKKIVSEEKMVLDSSGKVNIANPVDTPGVIPKELIPRPSEQNTASRKQAEPQVKPEEPANRADVKKDMKTTEPAKKVVLAMSRKPEVPTEKKPDQPQSTAVDTGAEVKQPQGQKEQAAEKPKKTATKKIKDTTKKKSGIKSGKKSHQKVAENKQANRMYSVQVGSFLDPKKALRLKEDLQGKGYTAHIVTARQPSGKTFSKVRIGGYRVKSDAEEIMPGLRKLGLDCIIVPAQK